MAGSPIGFHAPGWLEVSRGGGSYGRAISACSSRRGLGRSSPAQALQLLDALGAALVGVEPVHDTPAVGDRLVACIGIERGADRVGAVLDGRHTAHPRRVQVR